MQRELTINGTYYNETELLNHCTKMLAGSAQDWEKDYCRFILEWLNNSDTVEAKTSGSTGVPKQMDLLKQKMINSAKLTGEFFNFSKGKKVLFCLSPNYIAGKMMIVRAFVWGLDLIPVSPDGYPLKYTQEEFDFAAMIPLQVKNSLNTEKGLGQIRKLLIGGGAIHQDIENALRKVQTQCFIGYGMTETVSHIAIRSLSGSDKSDLYKAMGDAKFSTDDRDCLRIEAPAILNEPLLTNDVVELISEREFIWKGRFDSVVNSGGIKLFPEQIEKKLETIIPVPFFMAGVPDDHLGQKLVLIIESKELSEDCKCDLSDKMKSLLNKYEQAREIFYVSKFRRTATGKIQRKATLSRLIFSK